MSYMVVKCSACGLKTDKQPEGDGCHSCSRGFMERVLSSVDMEKRREIVAFILEKLKRQADDTKIYTLKMALLDAYAAGVLEGIDRFNSQIASDWGKL